VNAGDREGLLVEQPALEEELARHVAELAGQAGLALEIRPIVRVVAEEDVEPCQVRVEARWIPPEVVEVEQTRQMEEAGAEAEDPATISPQGRPFLVLSGQRHVDLLQAVVSIGRALDNDLIIEDSRVSRHHAQLRRRYGRYVLYDLGSSGGTQINGYPVEECVLHSGDVISFAGVQVIYGEDSPPPIPLPGTGDTPAMAPEEVEAD
jgi:pSer/pThr/pTyr-binding forkhead associated (FHA) protein